jgi:hypothetical protein
MLIGCQKANHFACALREARTSSTRQSRLSPTGAATQRHRQCDDLCGSELYWPPMLGSDTRVTGGGFHLPVSASNLGA